MAYPQRPHLQQQGQSQLHAHQTIRDGPFGYPPGTYVHADGSYTVHNGRLTDGASAQRPAMGMNGNRAVGNGPILSTTAQSQYRTRQPLTQPSQHAPYPYSHQDYLDLIHDGPTTQRNVVAASSGHQTRPRADLPELMGNMRLTGDPVLHHGDSAQQAPTGPASHHTLRSTANDHAYGAAPVVRGASPLTRPPQHAPSDTSFGHQYSHTPPPAAPVPLEGPGLKASAFRRSVTAPLPSLDTKMQQPNDTSPAPFAPAGPYRAPAYPGQRVYSPVTKERQRYQALGSQVPSSRAPSKGSSPTQSLNGSLASGFRDSGSPQGLAHRYGDGVPRSADSDGVHFNQQFEGDTSVLSQSHSFEASYIDPEDYLAREGHISAGHDSQSQAYSTTLNHTDEFALETRTNASSPRGGPVTTSPRMTCPASLTSDTQRTSAIDARPESIRGASTPNSQPPLTTGYVAYKPYNPTGIPVNASSPTPSPTQSAFPIQGGSGNSKPVPLRTSSGAPKAHLPQPQPPVSTGSAAHMMGARLQSNPGGRHSADTDGHTGGESHSGPAVIAEPGREVVNIPYMPVDRPINGAEPFRSSPPPIRHVPTAPVTRDQLEDTGQPPRMPHPAVAMTLESTTNGANGQRVPRPGPNAAPHGQPRQAAPGGAAMQSISHTGRSATMSSMTPPTFDRRTLPGRHGPPPMHLPGQGQMAPTAKPVPFRPGLGQPAPAPVRQYGPAPPQGPPPKQPPPAMAVAPTRTATMTSMVSAPVLPSDSGASGAAPPPADVAAGVAPNAGAVQAAAKDPPLTVDELRRWQNMAKANPSDDRIQYNYAKRLLEASRVLVAASPGNPKQQMKQRQAYLGEGLKVLKKCAHKNYPEAMFTLADGYGQGLWGLPKDPKEAFPLYASAARAGHGPSAYRTAVCCELGPDAGTRRDPMKAVQWYRRAASLGDTPAMYKMGMIQLKGLLGQPRSPREAITWLKRAAEQADEENPHALHELALLYENPGEANNIVIKDEKYAYELLERAGEFGYKYSQYRLGVIFEHGLLGFPPDPRQSIFWYTRAAAQGEHNSELCLSGWYLTGAEGILQQSDTEAYLWARKAAMAGLAKAEYAMGYFTEVGIGVPSNLEQAKKWYWKASSQNFVKARERLEDLKRGGAMMEKSKLSREQQQHNETDCVIM